MSSNIRSNSNAYRNLTTLQQFKFQTTKQQLSNYTRCRLKYLIKLCQMPIAIANNASMGSNKSSLVEQMDKYFKQMRFKSEQDCQLFLRELLRIKNLKTGTDNELNKKRTIIQNLRNTYVP
eukprot:24329_1